MPYSLQSILSDDPWRQAALSLADIAAKGLLLLAIALLLTAFLRRSSAAKRHLVWALTFAGILLLPLLEAFTPDLRLGILPGKTPASAEVQQTAPPLPTDVEPKHISALEPISHAPESPIREMDTSPEPSPTTPPSISNPSQLPDVNPPLSFLVMIVWLAGVMATAAPLLLGLFAIRRVTRKARPFAESRLDAIKESLTAELGIASRVSILRAAKGSMPMATGLWRPAILLPAEAAEWPDEKSRTVLLHELAHVKRRDCLTQFIASLAVALHWFNPLAWWALRQMRIERERACDDLVLAAGERPSSYAEQLLQIAHETHATTLISVAAITMAKRSQLEGRLEAVLDPKRNRNRVKKWSIVLGVLLLAAIAVPLGMLKVGEHRAFSNMTPEQRRDFDVWRTQKLTFPPEALEIKTFAPEIIARVRAFEAEWARSREEANTIADEWKEFLEAAGQIPILPSDFDEQLTKRLTKVDALVWRFESVVTHPEYDLDVWTVGIKTIAVEVDGKKHGGQQVPPSKDFPPHPDWASIRCAATLLQFKSGVMLEADDLPAATDCAEALVMAARVHPYTTNINRMVGVAILKLAYLPWEKIIEETKDPAILDQTRARLRADLEKIDLSLPPDLGWVAADNIGMIREARRWGIEGSIQNKTGLELMEEASAVRARYMRKYNLEEEAAIARLEKSIADIAHPKGIISRWTSPINAATLYSIALPGFERAEREMQKLRSQFAALADDPGAGKSASQPTSAALASNPVWGEEVDGLVAAVELRRVGLDPPPDNVTSDVGSESQPTPYTFAHGEAIDVRFRIKNVSDRTIRFSSEDLRQDHAILQDSSGKGISGNNLWFTAWPVQQSYELKPGKEVVLDNYDLALAANKAQADAFKHPIGSSFICPPGDYALHYAVKLPGVEQRDASGKTTVPRKGDWTGTLITGPVPITVVPASKPASKPQHAFAMYKVRTPVVPADEQQMRNLKLDKLELAAGPFLTDEDIVSYEWETHTIHLKPGVRERIMPDPKSVPLQGLPFVVVANGERIYLGAFWTPISSFLSYCPTIEAFGEGVLQSDGTWLRDAIRIGGAPTDPRIKAALGDKVKDAETMNTASIPASKPLHGFVVTGRVTTESGAPMKGVTIRAATGWGTLMPTGQTTTDADGRYTLHFGPGILVSNAPGGVSYQCALITAHKSSYFEQNLSRHGDWRMAGNQEAVAQYKGEDKEHTVVFPNQPRELNFVMLPAASISGTLVDENKKPIANRDLWITAEKLPPGSGVYATAKTDEKGNFIFENVPTSQPMWFVVRSTTGTIKKKIVELTTNPHQYLPQRYEVAVVFDSRENSLQAQVTEPDIPTMSPSTKEIGDTSMLLRDMQSPDEMMRAEATQKLGTIARTDKSALDALIKAMSDPSIRVQNAANQAMMNVGPVNIAAIRAVIRAVRANADKFSATGDHTGSTGGIVPTSQLFFAKLNDTHAYAIPDFVSLAKEPQVGVQRVAFQALTSIGTMPAELGPMLIEQLKKEQHPWVEKALVNMGPKAAPYVPDLIEMLNAKDWASKTAAARVLASIGRPAADPAIPVLEESVKIADDPQGIMSASLLKLDPQSKAALDRLGILATTPNGPDPTSSSYSRGLLIKYGRNVEQHTQGLVEALKDSNLRNSAVAVKMILENSSNKEARQAALEQAQRIRDSFDADDWTVQTVLQGLQSADKPLDQNP